MSETMVQAAATAPQAAWRQASQRRLELELERIRLLLRRRVLWLRTEWRQDPLQAYQGLVVSEEQADALLAGGGADAEARFYREDPGAASVGRLIRDIEAETLRHSRVRAAVESPAAIDVVTERFALTPFERDVLLLCLAPELDPTFERLCAYVQDDVTRKYVTPHLALSLLGRPSSSEGAAEAAVRPAGSGQHLPAGSLGRATTAETARAARDSFLPGAPLRRFRLVNVEPAPAPGSTLLASPLRLDERLVDYLRGVNRLDERVADLLQPLAHDPLPPNHHQLIDRVVERLSNDGIAGIPVNLVGERGAGKRAVASAVCDRLGLGAYALDVTRLPAIRSERRQIVQLLEREMVLMRSAVYLDAAANGATDPAVAASLADVLDGLTTLVIVGSRDRWKTDRDLVVVPVPKPDGGAQRALWSQLVADGGPRVDGEIDAIVQQFDLGPTAIAHALRLARSCVTPRPSNGPVNLTAGDVWHACRAVVREEMGDLAQRITPCYNWDDIVLPSDVLRQLREMAAQVAHRARVYEAWGFGRKLSRGRGISALFAGPSGTGKTMAAEVLANHLQLDVYRIDLAGVVSKYIGETEKNLRKVFDAAEQGGAILFFDEADALFGKRTEVKDSHDRYANIEIDYLLQRMEEYRGLAILATNRKSALDRAFLRRLRFLVDFPFPDAVSRRLIWQRVFPADAPVHKVDVEALARLEISGGNIKNVAVNAAFLAASDGTAITMSHVMCAARREYTKIDKIVTAAEFGCWNGMVNA
jgi:shikimate kinase